MTVQSSIGSILVGANEVHEILIYNPLTPRYIGSFPKLQQQHNETREMASTNWKTLLKAYRQENPHDKGRLDLHDVRVKPITLTHAGYAAFPEENEYAQPKKEQSEDLFILGSNTGEQTTIEVYFKRRPEPILGRFAAARDKVDVKFRLRDDAGNVYSMDESSIVEFTPVEYRGCGFAYEPLQGNRIGRIKYRGYLVKNGDASQLVYVRIRFLVLYFSKIVDHQRAFDDSCLLKQLKEVKEPVDSFTDLLEDKLEQFCQIKGTLNVEGETERELFFLGTVGRRFLPKKQTCPPRTVFKMCGFDVEGTGFQVGCIAQGSVNYFYALASKRGENFRVLKDAGTISQTTVDGLKNGQKTEFECKLTKGETTGESVKIEVEALEEEERPWRKVKVNGVNGMAFVEERLFEETETIREVIRSCGHELTEPLVVSLDEDCAQVPELTGGKGASLAQLKKLAQGKQWTVPNAVVVTCSAFKLQTDAMSDFEVKLQDLESKVINEQDVEKSCQDFVAWFAASDLNEKVQTELKSKMEAEFGSEWETLLLAVRSSASGEDSGEMSAAGQMTTYLGLSGAGALSRAVVSCWASQFAFVPVTYKRGYGQPIAAPMGVVVQRIVDCQAAGVIFTARPTDGDERVLTVSANFGLGESVVSAAAEPDNFTLSVDIQANSYQVKRAIKTISEKTLGKKALVTRLNKDSTITEIDQGTVNQQIVDGNTVQSIDDSDLLRLGAIALEIAAHYGTPHDLEFGLKEGVFHLFQSRPITNLDASFSAYELMHELDSAHLHERELYTRNHWGEIYQGASSWVATFYFSTGYLFAKMMVEDGALQPTDYNPYRAAFGQLCNQVMLNLGSDFPMAFFRKYPQSDTARAFVLAFFGREITDPEVLACIQTKPAKPAPKMSLRMKLQMGGMMWTAMSAKKKIAQLKREVILENKGDMAGAMEAVPLEGKLAFAMEAMVESFFTGSLFHMGTLAGSVIKSGILLKALKKEGVDLKVAEADHNLLLSHCTDVVSAEIPNRLREIAKSIENKEAFISLSDEEALQVLKGESGQETKAVEMCADFLRHHGHRGHRESDPLFLPLRRNPLPGVQVIKALLQSKASLEPSEPKSIDQLLGELQTPLGSLKKVFIKKYALRWCRNAVGYRENTKSIGTMSLNQMREAMWSIAGAMHARGLIPEVELFFYLKLDEIQQLIEEKRNPIFLWKAKQRRRLFPVMDRLRFDEYVKGFRMAPRPPKSEIIQVDGDVLLKGTAVTVGTVKGRVCVAETIAEASQIRPGDILLTYSTDIGWTPYFPLISAIVTEIGGTISHGAVIAREFGIPCLIAVDGACGRFRTGDWAFIDCAMGTIAKIKE